jgi:hypothetical protein
MSEILTFTWEADIPSAEAVRSCREEMRARIGERDTTTYTSRIFRYKDGANIISVADEFPNALACTGIPHADDTFWTPRHNGMPLWIDRERIYRRLGARRFRGCEGQEGRCCSCLRGTGEVPKLDGTIKRARCDPALLTAGATGK